MSKKDVITSAPQILRGFARSGRTVLHASAVADGIARFLELQATTLVSVAEGWQVHRWDNWILLAEALRAAARLIREPQRLPAAQRERLSFLDGGLEPAEVLHLPLPKLRAKLRKLERQRNQEERERAELGRLGREAARRRRELERGQWLAGDDGEAEAEADDGRRLEVLKHR